MRLELRKRSSKIETMRVLVSGSHGLIGSHLVAALVRAGHEVLRLVRSRQAGPHEVSWDPVSGTIDTKALEGIDAVVHLAGSNIAAHRWTRAIKREIRDSRIKGTRLLCHALADLETPPKTFISASAIGYYGDRGKTLVDEGSAAGSGFLPVVCRAWEAASDILKKSGIRVVLMRIGIVLSAEGGALSKMLPSFKLGVAGHIGNGKQFMSWICLDDVVGAFIYALEHEALEGPINVVAPEPVTNHQFSKTLGHVLHRPTIFPLPAFALRTALGEMADELLLSSTRVKPSKLMAAGYDYQYPQLTGALQHLLQH